jgi:enamine deaminase RidA (YjgF/YER057c/UK114 family)
LASSVPDGRAQDKQQLAGTTAERSDLLISIGDLLMPKRPRRSFLGQAALGLAGGALAASALAPAEAADEPSAAKIEGLFPQGAPAAAPGYSPGIRAEGRRVVFVSGQGPKDVRADMETQIHQTFERIGLVLKAGSASFKNVVMLRAYFVHLTRDLKVYRKVRMKYLAQPFPASTAVGVPELAEPGLEVEIEAMAIV